MATNVFFSPRVKSEQYLYEDIIIEALKLYGQDVYYIPRSVVNSDEILNEEFSKYESSYVIEMYIANTEGFEGEGNLLSKFGLEIRDQATFVVSRRRFSQLVEIDSNELREERPREGDLIYLPLSKSLFEIRFVEHENPFYQISNLPTYELQCELFEYSAEEFETGIRDIDRFEELNAYSLSIEISGGSVGFAPGDKIQQVLSNGRILTGEVSNFIYTSSNPPVADLYVHQIKSDDGSIITFDANGGPIENITRNTSDWSISNIYTMLDKDKYMINDPLAQNSDFEINGNDIIDWSEINPFGEPRI